MKIKPVFYFNLLFCRRCRQHRRLRFLDIKAPALYAEYIKFKFYGEMMKKLVTGILAHVDAGKTTLSEALLYLGGNLRKLGRVDHKNAFLDTDAQERKRGITIFSKQAILPLGDIELTLLDTPGHVDFSAEMERTLQVLDCAVLVISGTDGIQGHTRTLLRLLERYKTPTFLFINKMDLQGADRAALLSQLQSHLGGCIDFGDSDSFYESVAMCGDAALDEFLSEGTVKKETVSELIRERKIFPCRFGSALKLDGVSEFIEDIKNYAPIPKYPEEFGARVFKITRDSKNTRLTWLKVTGGILRAKELLSSGEGDSYWEEKADQLRLYSGEKFQPADEIPAGTVAAVTGLTHTYPGLGLGFETEDTKSLLEPVLNYRLILPEDAAPHTILPKLRQLEEEDPLLHIIWNEQLQEIHVRFMGQVQLEVLTQLIADRFGLNVTFGTGNIVYRETIANKVEGVGHFEPLQHYAEVHLILEPGERGSGIQFASSCSTDLLDLNWQRLILTHIAERDHVGVLTGSPITDIKITLTAGKAHLKHTEGGDFRQATYRAIRQGLMQAESVLLEPFYDFRIELPQQFLGRAINDLQSMGASVNAPEIEGDLSVLTGYATVDGLQNYRQELAAYTRGLGQISFTPHGYGPCHNAEEVISSIGYDPERDVYNTADSVFCTHGTGFTVKWNEVTEHMHLESTLRPTVIKSEEITPAGGARSIYTGSIEQDKELQAIFERTYGKTEPKKFEPLRKPARTELSDSYTIKERVKTPEYLLVDGYNIIFAWKELKELALQDIAAARSVLENILINYQGFRKCTVILVFDAYKVKGNPGSVEKKSGIYVVYTKEAETADAYIEKTTYKLGKNSKVRVATSDGLEQVIILGHGALRVSAESFRLEVEETVSQISRLIAAHNAENQTTKIKHAAQITKKRGG